MKRVVLFLFAAACSLPAAALFQTAPGYGSTQLVAPGISFNGLDYDNGILYYGQGPEVHSYNLSNGAIATVGQTNGMDNALVARHADTTYVAYADQYGMGVDYHMGYFDGEGIYQHQLTMVDIYDAAVNANGDCYLAAKPGDSGTQIYRYDWQTGQALLTATVGGYSGGIAFDSQGNLYYADQNSGAVLRFTAAQVQAGNLTAADGQALLDGLYAGYIGFDDQDNFYATYAGLDGSSYIAQFDLAGNQKIIDYAFGDWYNVGKFVVADETIYLIESDWTTTYTSSIRSIYAVPEPATLLLLSAGILLVKRKR